MPTYPGMNAGSQLGSDLNLFGGGTALAGSFDSPNGARIDTDCLVIDGTPVVAFVETAFDSGSGLWVGRGPNVVYWDGSAWTQLGTDTEPSMTFTLPYYGGEQGTPISAPFPTGDRVCPSRPQLAYDGARIYLGYTIRVGAPPPDGEDNWDARNVVLKYYDGTDWVLITEILPLTYNTWFGTGLAVGSFGGIGDNLSLGATTNDPGHVYVSWNEEGPQSGIFGFNAFPWSQRWYCQGYNWSGGSQVFSHDIYSHDDANWAAAGFPVGPPNYNHRFCEGDSTLYLLYTDPAVGSTSLNMLDVLTDTVTSVPVSSPSTGLTDIVPFASANRSYTPTGGGAEVIYVAPLQGTLRESMVAQVNADTSGVVETVFNDPYNEIGFVGNWLLTTFGASYPMTKIIPVDDLNFIVMQFIPEADDYGYTLYPTIYHRNCGPIYQGADSPEIDGTSFASVDFDPTGLTLYGSAEQFSTGAVQVYSWLYVPDEFHCGFPCFNNRMRLKDGASNEWTISNVPVLQNRVRLKDGDSSTSTPSNAPVIHSRIRLSQ